MKKKLATLLVLSTLALSSGCYHNEIVVSRGYDANVAQQPSHTSSFRPYLLLSLIPLGDPIDLSQVCEGKEAGYIEVEMSVVNSIVNIFTGWLVSFQSVKVWCA